MTRIIIILILTLLASCTTTTYPYIKSQPLVESNWEGEIVCTDYASCRAEAYKLCNGNFRIIRRTCDCHEFHDLRLGYRSGFDNRFRMTRNHQRLLLMTFRCEK